jgi:tetratricopeptide (TPR) repeat protein
LELEKPRIGHVPGSIVLALCFLIYTGWTTPCRAADRAEAKNRFMEGMGFVQGENYLAALEAFEASYRIFPKASVLFNIGMCQKALYRYVDAIGTFKKFLAEAGDDVKPELKRDAQTALTQLDDLVGKLLLQGVPVGAKVWLNDIEVELAHPILVDPGTYALEVTKEGFEPLRAQVTLTLGAEVKVPAALTHKEKKLSPMMISGIVLGAVGLAGVGVGAYFAARYQSHYDDLETAGESYLSAPDETAAEPYWQEYYNIKDNKLPNDQAGAIAGFVVGGTLVLTGVALIVADVVKKNKKESSAVSVLPSPGGITVLF